MEWVLFIKAIVELDVFGDEHATNRFERNIPYC